MSGAPELIKQLGQGSYGSVWKARDSEGRELAVKIVPLQDSAAEGVTSPSRILSEIICIY